MIGNRIQRARKALGLSLRDVAAQLDLSHAAIKKYEDNETTPSSETLIKLSRVLKVKVEYFFRPERFTLANIQYRKHDNIPLQHLEEIQIKMLDKIEQRIELENLFPSTFIHEFLLPNLPQKITHEDDLEVLAEQIRHQWCLGLEPLTDLIDLFEEHGIKVFEIDNSQYPKFDGFFAKVNSFPVIVIGNQWPGDRQRFTLAHELGHLLLGNILSQNLDEEKCCHRFAGAFLLPKPAILAKLGEYRNNIEPIELNLLKQEFGVSMLSILHRAKDAKILSPILYSQLRKEFNQRGWTQQEPGEPYPKEKTHLFEQLVFHALAEEYIGESKAAEFMNISIESFKTIRAMERRNVAPHQ